ncbi:CBO0543 family protein [Niallia taxi]|uniref:CBO0543 family protein n=1 Tax=Niallia taxi TaxID=2499688 RepID=UPI00317E4A11
MKNTQVYEDFAKKQQQLEEEKLQIWLDHSLFTFQWWLGAVLLIISIVLFIIFRKRNSTDRLLYVGTFTALLSSLLDLVGNSLGFFHYHYEVIPFTDNYFPWSISIIPVSIMFLLQVKPNISSYIKATALSLLVSFVILPFLEVIGIYHPVNWEYYYSSPVIFVIYLIADYLSKKDRFTKLYEE